MIFQTALSQSYFYYNVVNEACSDTCECFKEGRGGGIDQ